MVYLVGRVCKRVIGRNRKPIGGSKAQNEGKSEKS